MSYRAIIQILLVVAIISTVCIGIMKPKMHEPVMVYNSQFSVEHEESVKVDEKNIAVMVQNSEIQSGADVKVENEGGINFVEPKIEDVKPVNFIKNETKTQNINLQNSKNQVINNTKVKTNGTNFKNSNTNVKTSPVTASNNSVKSVPAKANNYGTQSNTAPKIDLNKIVNNNHNIINNANKISSSSSKPVNSVPINNAPVQAVKNIPAQNTVKPVQEVKPPVSVNSHITSNTAKPQNVKVETKPVVLTAAQEEIAWNKWRSNLNNQIMKDSKLPTMPNGIIFKYKFTVDKYGKVSNVQTSSTTPGYTPYAIQFIAPVIRSYQGRAILNFPAGSNRTSTEVSGAWKISSNARLSTPDDFNDIEKIKR